MKLAILRRADIAARAAMDKIPHNATESALDYRRDLGAKLAESTAPLRAAIDTALAKVNGQATAHTINCWYDLTNVIEQTESHLAARGIKPAKIAPAKVIYAPAGPSHGYKYATISTQVELLRTAAGWYLIGVERVHLSPGQSRWFEVQLSAQAIEAIERFAFESIKAIA